MDTRWNKGPTTNIDEWFSASDGIFQHPRPIDGFDGTEKKPCTPWSMPRVVLYTWEKLTFSFGPWIYLIRAKRVLNSASLVRVVGVMRRGYYSHQFSVFINLILVLATRRYDYRLRCDYISLRFAFRAPFLGHIRSENSEMFQCVAFHAFYPPNTLVITMVTSVVCRTSDRNTLVHRSPPGRNIHYIKLLYEHRFASVSHRPVPFNITRFRFLSSPPFLSATVPFSPFRLCSRFLRAAFHPPTLSLSPTFPRGHQKPSPAPLTSTFAA